MFTNFSSFVVEAKSFFKLFGSVSKQANFGDLLQKHQYQAIPS